MMHITDNDFDEKVEGSRGILIVDFYADWCGACHEMLSILERIERKYPQINICMLDTIENKKTAKKYWIMSLPTIIFFQDGMEVKRKIGILEEEEMGKILMEL